MTVFKKFLPAALLAAIVAPALAASAVGTVSGNDFEYQEESSIESESVSSEEIFEENSLLDESLETDNDNFDSLSGNSFPSESVQFESESESESFELDYSDSYLDSEIMPLQNYNTYYGSISSTYLEYMRGFLSKLSFDEHYVAARVGQYDYIFAFGKDLSYNGSFTGSAITVITFNTYNNGSYSSSLQSSFSLSPGSYMVYSDLSDLYPSLATSSDLSLRQIVFVLGIIIVFYTAGSFFVRKAVKGRSRRWRL